MSVWVAETTTYGYDEDGDHVHQEVFRGETAEDDARYFARWKDMTGFDCYTYVFEVPDDYVSDYE